MDNMDNMLSFEERVSNLLILGSGQYGAIAHEIAEALGHFNKIDFLDDNDRAGLAIGKIKDIGKFAVEYGSAIPAVGDPDLRRYFMEKIIAQNCFHIPTLVHPRAFVGKYARLRKGCIVEPMAVIQSGTEIGESVLVSAGAVVSHSVVIGDYSHIDAGSVVPAHSIIAPWSKVDAGTVVSTDKRSEMNKGIIWFDSDREKSETADDAVC